MECDPLASAVVANVALPLTSVPVPSVVLPSLKVTIPVAVLGVTVAVNDTDCPNDDGLVPEVTVVVVEPTFTTCTSTEEALELKFESPLYTAVIECVPTDNAEVLKVACPPLSVPTPIDEPPSLKVTMPVARVEDTVAVNVTDAPSVEGLSDETSEVVVVALFTTCDSVPEVLPL